MDKKLEDWEEALISEIEDAETSQHVKQTASKEGASAKVPIKTNSITDDEVSAVRLAEIPAIQRQILDLQQFCRELEGMKLSRAGTELEASVAEPHEFVAQLGQERLQRQRQFEEIDAARKQGDAELEQKLESFRGEVRGNIAKIRATLSVCKIPDAKELQTKMVQIDAFMEKVKQYGPALQSKSEQPNQKRDQDHVEMIKNLAADMEMRLSRELGGAILAAVGKKESSAKELKHLENLVSNQSSVIRNLQKKIFHLEKNVQHVSVAARIDQHHEKKIGRGTEILLAQTRRKQQQMESQLSALNDLKAQVKYIKGEGRNARSGFQFPEKNRGQVKGRMEQVETDKKIPNNLQDQPSFKTFSDDEDDGRVGSPMLGLSPPDGEMLNPAEILQRLEDRIFQFEIDHEKLIETTQLSNADEWKFIAEEKIRCFEQTMSNMQKTMDQFSSDQNQLAKDSTKANLALRELREQLNQFEALNRKPTERLETTTRSDSIGGNSAVTSLSVRLEKEEAEGRDLRTMVEVEMRRERERSETLLIQRLDELRQAQTVAVVDRERVEQMEKLLRITSEDCDKRFTKLTETVEQIGSDNEHLLEEQRNNEGELKALREVMIKLAAAADNLKTLEEEKTRHTSTEIMAEVRQEFSDKMRETDIAIAQESRERENTWKTMSDQFAQNKSTTQRILSDLQADRERDEKEIARLEELLTELGLAQKQDLYVELSQRLDQMEQEKSKWAAANLTAENAVKALQEEMAKITRDREVQGGSTKALEEVLKDVASAEQRHSQQREQLSRLHADDLAQCRAAVESVQGELQSLSNMAEKRFKALEDSIFPSNIENGQYPQPNNSVLAHMQRKSEEMDAESKKLRRECDQWFDALATFRIQLTQVQEDKIRLAGTLAAAATAVEEIPARQEYHVNELERRVEAAEAAVKVEEDKVVQLAFKMDEELALVRLRAQDIESKFQSHVEVPGLATAEGAEAGAAPAAAAAEAAVLDSDVNRAGSTNLMNELVERMNALERQYEQKTQEVLRELIREEIREPLRVELHEQLHGKAQEHLREKLQEHLQDQAKGQVRSELEALAQQPLDPLQVAQLREALSQLVLPSVLGGQGGGAMEGGQTVPDGHLHANPPSEDSGGATGGASLPNENAAGNAGEQGGGSAETETAEADQGNRAREECDILDLVAAHDAADKEATEDSDAENPGPGSGPLTQPMSRKELTREITVLQRTVEGHGCEIGELQTKVKQVGLRGWGTAEPGPEEEGAAERLAGRHDVEQQIRATAFLHKLDGHIEETEEMGQELERRMDKLVTLLERRVDRLISGLWTANERNVVANAKTARQLREVDKRLRVLQMQVRDVFEEHHGPYAPTFPEPSIAAARWRWAAGFDPDDPSSPADRPSTVAPPAAGGHRGRSGGAGLVARLRGAAAKTSSPAAGAGGESAGDIPECKTPVQAVAASTAAPDSTDSLARTRVRFGPAKVRMSPDSQAGSPDRSVETPSPAGEAGGAAARGGQRRGDSPSRPVQ